MLAGRLLAEGDGDHLRRTDAIDLDVDRIARLVDLQQGRLRGVLPGDRRPIDAGDDVADFQPRARRRATGADLSVYL